MRLIKLFILFDCVMYKLHYDVNAGKQVNVVYKGMEIEVEAGEGGEGGDIEIQTNKTVTLNSNGTYEINPTEDFDVMKKVTATVNVPTPTIEEYKSSYIGDNGIHYINPSSGYDAMESVQVNVDVPGPIVEANKIVNITENGTVEVYPSNGKEVMEKVTAVVNVPSSSDVEVEENKSVTITENGTVEITPSIDKDAMAKVTATINVSGGGSLPLDNPTYISNGNYMYVPIDASGEYICYQNMNGTLIYRDDSNNGNVQREIVIQPISEDIQVNIDVPVLPYSYPLDHIVLPNAVFYGGDQTEHPILLCDVTGDVGIIQSLTIGGSAREQTTFRVKGKITLVDNLILNGCDLYWYNDRLENPFFKSIRDEGFGGHIHVLTTYSGDDVAGHAVIKDLTLPAPF